MRSITKNRAGALCIGYSPCAHLPGGSSARSVADPPPYRENASLRGPRHLVIAVDGLGD
jgi:hypothetical protein